MEEKRDYVCEDQAGVLRVGTGGVMLDSVVAAFELGHSAETIREQYPVLTLEEVYGAIAYYLGHREAVGKYLERQDAEWAKWRAKSEARPNPALARLRALGGAGARGDR